jgi:hypothetical protein
MLLVGGTLAWLSSAWPGLALHQAGYALVFVTLLGNSQTSAARAPVPWPLVSLTLALGTLAIWWDSTSGEAPAARVPSWLTRRVEPWWTRLRSSKLDRWPSSWLGQHLAALLPAIALASLAGLPLTAGAIGRWRFYADIVYGKHTALLLVALVADTLLAAGLWTALRTASQRRPGAASLAAMIALALPLVVWGVAPNHLAGAVDLSPIKTPGVSTWRLGFLFVLPWLTGAGLAYVSARQAGSLDRLRLVTGLPWLYRAAAWVGDRLGGALYWLGQVGEGEGWWGWAIILLALGALFLVVR